MTSTNDLVCFTNCLLPQEDGKLIQKDLWIDERRGVILDAQKTFFLKKQRPGRIIDLEGNILSPGLIDIQINGAYDFDFSIYDGDDEAYRAGLKKVAENIVETGVTSLVPTVITQEQSLYPKLLNLLKPYSSDKSANLLGWHAEGPFLEMAKRGAHAPPFLMSAPEGFKTFEKIYGAENLVDKEDWLMMNDPDSTSSIRIITAAPELEGVMNAIDELHKRGVVFSIGHSIATSDIATSAVYRGARLITHLFNAMPQLHHRDPSIIGLLGASPYLNPRMRSGRGVLDTKTVASSVIPSVGTARKPNNPLTIPATSEAFDDLETPLQSPGPASALRVVDITSGIHTPFNVLEKTSRPGTSSIVFERPFYDIIVDGIHSHPNSVRLAYTAHPEGCILITDAMKILDPNLKDGVHEWRDGQRFVKEGLKLYLEGTNTLAGSVVTLDKCVRTLAQFTGCSLGEAIKCATYNPAKCLGIENRKGTLRAGADADLVVLDSSGHVLSTWVKGKKVWSKSG